MGNNKGIFSAWLKNFCCLVFTQSFQAIFMCMIILVISAMLKSTTINVKKEGLDFTGEGERGLFLCSIVAYVGVTSIIKLDKLIRKIFGIDDSELLGDLGKGMRQLMHTAMHLKNFGGRMVQGVKSFGDAGKDLASKAATRNKIGGNIGKINELAAPKNATIDVKNLNSGTGKGKNTTGMTNSINLNTGSSGMTKDQIMALFSDPNFDPSKMGTETMGERLFNEADNDYEKARKTFKRSGLKAGANIATGMASFLLANGGSDSVEETVAAADHIHRATYGVAREIIDPDDGIRGIAKNIRDGVDAYGKQIGKELSNSSGKSFSKGGPSKEIKQAINNVNNATDSYQKRVADDLNKQANNIRNSSASNNIQKAASDVTKATENYSKSVSDGLNKQTKEIDNARTKNDTELKKAADNWKASTRNTEKGNKK